MHVLAERPDLFQLRWIVIVERVSGHSLLELFAIVRPLGTPEDFDVNVISRLVDEARLVLPHARRHTYKL